MAKRAWLVVAIVLVAIAIAGGMALGSRRNNTVSATPVAAGRTAPSGSSVIPVDLLASTPDQHLGRVTVTGSVTSVDAATHSLVLGCADACVAVPVKFSGTLPKPGSNVEVRGTISKSGEGKYAFVATDVTPR